MDPMQVLAFATPIGLAAIGETIAQRSGVINIGLEGTMLGSAYFAMLVSLLSGNPWLGIAAGTAAGLLITLVFSVFTISVGADQVVVGTAINLFAIGLTGTLYRDRFGSSGELLSVPTVPSWHGFDAIIGLMIVSAIFAWFLLQRTNWGLAARGSGEYPKAVEAAGFRVSRIRYGAMILAGVFGGLGGAYLSVGLAGSFAENMTQGRGFVAIAMVTFGRWKPQWVLLASVLIGFVESLQFVFQALGSKIPVQLLLAMPYVAALLVLVLVGKGGMAPSALGQSYRRDS